MCRISNFQFISHQNDRYGQIDGVRMVLEGGCRWIQLRMKDASRGEIVDAGREMRRLCDEYNAVLIVDDYVDLVKLIGADGVHLGKNDMPVAEARVILGHSKIIGATANAIDDIVMACQAGADYIGLGPYRFTTTKKRLSPVLGLDGYRQIMDGCAARGIGLPVVAIGGITSDDVVALMATGVHGVAVSGALLGADDPVAETKSFLKYII